MGIKWEDDKTEKELQEADNFRWWVQNLTREANEVREELNKLSRFESEIQKAEFKKQLDGKFYGKISLGVVKVKTKKTDDNFYPSTHLCFADWRTPEDYYIYEIKDFLLSQGKDWYKAAGELSEQLATVLPEVTEIRRNILYPEVAKMEEKIAYLEAKVKTLESDLERTNHNFSVSNQVAADLTQKLAEKEKEIGELKNQKEKTRKIVFEIGKWTMEGNSICNELYKIRSRFKSVKVETLRNRLKKIFSEMTIAATKILHPDQWRGEDHIF